MQMRTLTIADAAALLDFYQSLGEQTVYFFAPWPFTEEAIRDHLTLTDQGDAVSLGLVNETGEIEGHGFLKWVRSETPSFGIGLRERVQGQGEGRRLMDAVMARADELALAQVGLGVRQDNLRAIALYQTLGFVITGEHPNDEGSASWTMCRPRPV
ncbi:MAG TPA: N-acetyltransferase [Armatimonadota bacterium]|jgi:ribosomal protein S18 acetylase RimI-like enzyme